MLSSYQRIIWWSVLRLITSRPMATSPTTTPDFIVKLADERVIVVETNGREDVDAAPKMRRLRQWCGDVIVIATKNYTFTHWLVGEASQPRLTISRSRLV